MRNLELADELGVDHGLEPDLVELFERGDERLGDVPPAELAEPARAHARTVRLDRVPGVARDPDRGEVPDRTGRVAAGDQGLADQDPVGAGRGILADVVDGADAGLGDGDDGVRDQRAQSAEHRAVDLERAQVTGVDPDDGRAGVDGATGLVRVVDLDECRHPERFGVLAQVDEVALVERRDDEQDQVGTQARASVTW